MATESKYVVYILLCADGTLYTGITTDVTRRFQEHQAGTASNYTRAHGAKAIVYTETCANRGSALKREYAIKQLSRSEKQALLRTWSGDKLHV